MVPPTDVRILRMLEGTPRKRTDIIGAVPPNLAPISVEKVAINAVMAGCRPEYLPVVIAALEAALEPLFTMHGLLCTTCFSSPIIVVNGPIVREIGMNSGINCLGQGNRANATIGRALQLIIRNVGGGKPGELDRAVLGNPGNHTFCFAEDRSDSTWTPLSVARGIPAGKNAVTLFQGDGIFRIHRSAVANSRGTDEIFGDVIVGRRPSETVRVHKRDACFGSRTLRHLPQRGMGSRQDHKGTAFRNGKAAKRRRAGSKRCRRRRRSKAQRRIHQQVLAGGVLIVHAGGQAGLFSAICAGWTGGRFRDEF